MKYGRTKYSATLHMLVDGKALCYPGSMPIVEVVDEPGEDYRHVCNNCDTVLRQKARRTKRPRSSNPKAEYTPRNRFEDM